MKDDRVFLQHILDAINKIEEYAAVGRETFMAASHWQDAVIRQLEIVGEATKRLSPALRLRCSSVPRRRIAGLRDVLIHNYMGVDLDAVWTLTQTRIPELQAQIASILQDMDKEQQ